MKKCKCGRGNKRCNRKCIIDKISTAGALMLLAAIGNHSIVAKLC